MADAQFSVLEHKLPERIGLPLEEIRSRRNARLVNGEDWLRIGRWIKYSEAGLAKLQDQVGVTEIKAEPPEPEWRDAVVTRVVFPNPRIIECQEFNGGAKFYVAIHPDWRRCYRPKMPIKIKVGNERLATTRRPRGVYRF
jgi:hypothetical protein